MKKNKLYVVLTAVMVIGFGFFFTTKLWGSDDRTVMNTFSNRDMHNSQVLIRGEAAYFIEPLHGLDLVIERTYFNGTQSSFELRVVVHNLDGSSYEAELIYLSQAWSGNQDRVLARLFLDEEQSEWYYIELILIDSMTQEERNLTIDYRRVERVQEVKEASEYDLTYPNPLPSIWESTEGLATESPTVHEGEANPPTYSKEELQQQLTLKGEELERVKNEMKENPDDVRLKEVLEWYEEEISSLEKQIKYY